MSAAPWVVAITGASGAPYAVRLLEVLARAHVPLWLIISRHGWRLLELEAGVTSDAELKQATGGDWSSVTVFDDADRGAAPASGSARSAGMVICPCSMGAVAAIAHGTSRSLVERAGDVALKEGATVIPAAPGFYGRPTQVEQLVDFVVQRVLDHMGVDASLAPRWEGRG